jgi:hypothetical protein
MKVFTLFSFMLMLFSCTKDHRVFNIPRPENCDSLRFTYTSNISRILISNCTFSSCHGDNSEYFSLTTYPMVKASVNSGNFEYRIDLPPSDPQHMPEGLTLSKCDYFILKTWIHQGYPEN